MSAAKIFLNMALPKNLWVICATIRIKWTHSEDMYGPTYDESNNNLKALFPNCFSFKSLFKIKGLRLLKEKQLMRCNEEITGKVGI